VEVTELMGNEILIYLNTGTENSIVARVDPRSHYAFGDKVQVLFNMDNSHIFDASENAENPIAVK
jgi:ABC-type sugar transport system ATPase subunit